MNMNRESIPASDPQITAYALGEMSPDERQLFENQLANSPAAQAELDEIRETVSWIEKGFLSEPIEGEKRESILEMGDPQLTALALGELDEQAAEEMEVRLSVSAEAKGEFAEITETVADLKAAFAAEIGQEVAEDSVEEKIVRFDFRKFATPLKYGGVAAAMVAMMVVGALLAEKGAASGKAMAETAPENFRVPVLSGPSGHGEFVPASFSTGGGSQIEAELQIPTLSGQTIGESVSYLDFEPLTLSSANVGADFQLPGMSELGKGKPFEAHITLKNEAAKHLPDEDFGHGNLSFAFRRKANGDGSVTDTVTWIDTRISPDGEKSVSEKQFVRQAVADGRSVDEVVQNLNLGNPEALRGAGFRLLGGEPEPKVSAADELSDVLEELKSVRNALDLEPDESTRRELQHQLRGLIDRQQVLAENLLN